MVKTPATSNTGLLLSHLHNQWIYWQYGGKETLLHLQVVRWSPCKIRWPYQNCNELQGHS